MIATRCPAIFPSLCLGLIATAQAVLSETPANRFDPARVATGELDPALAERGWMLLTKRNVDVTLFRALDPDTIRIHTDRSNALIYREPAPGREPMRPLLTWEWRVDTWRTGEGTGRDPDWPVVVYAAFDVDRQYIGWWRRLINRVTLGAAGLPATGKILTYVWSPNETTGRRYPNPYIPKIGFLQVLRSADEMGKGWFAERRDLFVDFESAFDHPAKEVSFIAISADGEDSHAAGEAFVRALRLE